MWQLFQGNAKLDEVVGIPNSEWQKLPKNHTSINILQDNYWKAAQGEAIWVKVRLPRILNTQKIWLELSPNVGLDGMLALRENGVWRWQHPAGRRASDAPDYPATFLSFQIQNPREHRIVYLKVHSSQIVHFSVNVRTDEEQLSYLVKNNLFNGIVFGLLLLAVVYNLVIGITAGERLYVYYASYVFCTLLYLLSMTAYTRFSFPEWGDTGNFSNLSVLLAFFTAILFVSELLETKHYTPKLDRFLKIIQSLVVISIFLVGFVSDLVAYILAEVLGIIVPLAVLFTGICAYIRKQAFAKYFLIAWSFLIVTVFAWALMWLGFVEPSSFTLRWLIWGSVGEVLLLSLLLGYRYSELKRKTLSLSEDKNKYLTNADIDHLSGVLNRQGLYKEVSKMLKNSKNELIWIEIDIDEFHNFNLQYGEQLGDRLLIEFGELLKTKVRRDNLAAKLIDKENSFSYRRGVVGRTTGGKFTLLLSNCSMPQARLYCERLIKDFSSIKIKTKEAKWASSTISMGVILVMPGERFESAWKRSQSKIEEMTHSKEKEKLLCS